MRNTTQQRIASAASRHGWSAAYMYSHAWEYAKDSVRVRIEWSASGGVARAQRCRMVDGGWRNHQVIRPGDKDKTAAVLALLAKSTVAATP